MLSSLPPITPRDAHTLWSPTTYPTDPPDPTTNNTQHPRREKQARNPILAALDAEEEALLARKTNVRRFGATWLRPPGVSKTYQAMVDEAAERAEQEAIARRDAAMAEQQAAAEEEARRLRAEQGGMGDVDGVEEEGMERDLDEEVPEGMSDGEDEDSEEDEEDEEEEMRDLDDDVPEVGSYEHTDTEVEDESSEDEVVSPAQMAEEHVTPGSGRSSGRGPTVVQSMRMPIPPLMPGSGVSSSHGDPDSSMVISSPTMARPPRRAQAQGRTRGAPSNLRENQRST